jgi:sugar lactone lactonase YvrE
MSRDRPSGCAAPRAGISRLPALAIARDRSGSPDFLRAAADHSIAEDANMSEVQSPQPPAHPASPPTPHTIRRVVLACAVVLVALAAYLLVWPSPIDPVAYEPAPPMALAGPLAPNQRLESAQWLAVGQVRGPEDVEIDGQGNIVTGTEDGRIVRVDPQGAVTVIATTGGRPTGLAKAPDGRLIVADSVKGLLSIDPQGEVTTLVPARGDVPLGFADDVAVASDGVIYFSDASSKFGHDEYLFDMLEGRPHGRLLRYDPASKETKVLLEGLYFANGVALSKDEDFLLLNETYRFRTRRYWLKGDRAGEHEVVLDQLPGYPDNVTAAPDGTFWLALFTVRNDRAEWLSPRPFAKRVLAKLPGFLWPKPQPYAFVVKLDAQGQIVDSLQDPSGQRLFAVTSAMERDGYLYLGSLINDRIGKYKLP